MTYQNDIKGLHHSAFRCRDSEETRQFYEDMLGLRLADGIYIEASKTGRPIKAFHSFYELDDGSFLAFFELIQDEEDFVFHDQSDFDLHIALTVSDLETLQAYKDRATRHDLSVRGPVDHTMCHSIYLRDPNGYVIELACPADDYAAYMERANGLAHQQLNAWQTAKQSGKAS